MAKMRNTSSAVAIWAGVMLLKDRRVEDDGVACVVGIGGGGWW